MATSIGSKFNSFVAHYVHNCKLLKRTASLAVLGSLSDQERRIRLASPSTWTAASSDWTAASLLSLQAAAAVRLVICKLTPQ